MVSIEIGNARDDIAANSYGVPERFTPTLPLALMAYDAIEAVHTAAAGEAATCRVSPGSGWFGTLAAEALDFDVPTEGTEEYAAFKAAMVQRLKALAERGVLVVKAVEGVGSQARPARCYRQGALPDRNAWDLRQGLERNTALQ